LKFHEFSKTVADDFVVGDLRDQSTCRAIVDRRFDEVYQLAADMGGAGYIFTGEHDAELMHNSATINLNMLDVCHKRDIRKIFYSSSACMYPAYNQEEPLNPNCSEDSAYPADDKNVGRHVGGSSVRSFSLRDVPHAAAKICPLPEAADTTRW
jgi:nucleoside-diphosphate-sugar epimerase